MEPADLVMAYLLSDGLSPVEDAERLGIPNRAVRTRLERWRQPTGEAQPELAAWLGEAST